MTKEIKWMIGIVLAGIVMVYCAGYLQGKSRVDCNDDGQVTAALMMGSSDFFYDAAIRMSPSDIFIHMD